MRTVPPLTHFHLPTALELQKLKEKSLLIYIIIGKQINNEQDNLFEIQLDSGIVTLEELALKLRTIIDENPPEEQDKTVVVLKADRDVEMGLVNDIRQILRDVRLLTVYYTVEKER